VKRVGFWSERKGIKPGKCRRFPPKVAKNGDTVWPETEKSDWCGKYETKDDE